MHTILKEGIFLHFTQLIIFDFIGLYMNINTIFCSFVKFYRHADQDSDGHISFKDFENVISYGLANTAALQEPQNNSFGFFSVENTYN